jgi:hypothetical protein
MGRRIQSIALMSTGKQKHMLAGASDGAVTEKARAELDLRDQERKLNARRTARRD